MAGVAKGGERAAMLIVVCRVGFHDADTPHGVNDGGAVGAIGEGEGVKHIGRRRLAGEGVLAGNNEPKRGGHFAQNG